MKPVRKGKKTTVPAGYVYVVFLFTKLVIVDTTAAPPLYIVGQ